MELVVLWLKPQGWLSSNVSCSTRDGTLHSYWILKVHRYLEALCSWDCHPIYFQNRILVVINFGTQSSKYPAFLLLVPPPFLNRESVSTIYCEDQCLGFPISIIGGCHWTGCCNPRSSTSAVHVFITQKHHQPSQHPMITKVYQL